LAAAFAMVFLSSACISFSFIVPPAWVGRALERAGTYIKTKRP
jgi:hypothetical protein